uniref:Transmembrane protein 238a n=1 Tax=Astyanax mexicanus TaxID=7994 RepID=A0A3B1K022_ASTMX
MDLRFIGACAPLFLLALLFDVVGFVLLFVGIFANLQVNGRFYGDFLIHTGGVLVFCSLGWWLMWYAGNIQVSREGASRGRGGTAHRCKQLARKLTERLSRTQLNKGEDIQNAQPLYFFTNCTKNVQKTHRTMRFIFSIPLNP